MWSKFKSKKAKPAAIAIPSTKESPGPISPAAELIQDLKFTPSPFAPPSPLLSNSAYSTERTNEITPNGVNESTPRILSKKGGQESSPWLEVDSTGQKTNSNLRETEREEKEVQRGILGVKEVILLIQECSKVINQRGLTKLGLLRPYRTSESPDNIRSLCLLFLAHAKDSTVVEKDLIPRELWSSSRKSKLEAFVEAITSAPVVDVCCVLKWGLAHLQFTSTTAFSKLSPSDSLSWYTTLNSPTFTTILKSLPSTSQNLLLETIHLMESVVSFTDSNAMTIRRLSLSFGIYIFGLNGIGKEWKDWDQVRTVWFEAGMTLEKIFKSYLAEQRDLPKRLREIKEEKVSNGRKVKVLVVEIVSEGNWNTGLNSNDQETGKIGLKLERVLPIDLLSRAFEMELAESLSIEEVKLWESIREIGKENGAIGILDDEMRRVLKVVGLGLSSQDQVAEVAKPSVSLLADGSPSLDRRPSFVHQSSTSSIGTKRYSGRYDGQRRITPDWSTFTKQGFGESEGSLQTGEFGLVEREIKRRPSNRDRTLKKNQMKEKSNLISKRENISKIMKIQSIEIEEEFLDFYLLTLISPSFPSFIISSLDTKLFQNSENSNLLIAETFIPFAPLVPEPSLNSNLLSPISSILSTSKSFSSTTESTKKRNFLTRRISSLFSRDLADRAKLAGATSVSSTPLPETIVEVKTPEGSPTRSLIKLPIVEQVRTIEEVEEKSKVGSDTLVGVGSILVAGAGISLGLVGISKVEHAIPSIEVAESETKKEPEEEVQSIPIVEEPIVETVEAEEAPERAPESVEPVTEVSKQPEVIQEEEKVIDSPEPIQEKYETILAAAPLALPVLASVPAMAEEEVPSVIEPVPVEKMEPVIEKEIEVEPVQAAAVLEEPIVERAHVETPIVEVPVVEEPVVEPAEPVVEKVEATLPEPVEPESLLDRSSPVPAVMEEVMVKSPTKEEKGKGREVLPVEDEVVIPTITESNGVEKLEAEIVSVEPATAEVVEVVETPAVVEAEPLPLLPVAPTTPVKVKEVIEDKPTAKESPIIATPAWTPSKESSVSTPIKSIPTVSPALDPIAFSTPTQPKWLSSPQSTPASPEIPPKDSPNTDSSAKKFLKTGLAGFRKKKSKSNLITEQQIIEEKTAKDLRETEKREKKANVIKSPKVVSSVRLRVEELELKKKDEALVQGTRNIHSSGGRVKKDSILGGGKVESLPAIPLPVPVVVEKTVVEEITPTLPTKETELLPSLPVEEKVEVEPVEKDDTIVGLGINASKVSLIESSASEAHTFATALSGSEA